MDGNVYVKVQDGDGTAILTLPRTGSPEQMVRQMMERGVFTRDGLIWFPGSSILKVVFGGEE